MQVFHDFPCGESSSRYAPKATGCQQLEDSESVVQAEFLVASDHRDLFAHSLAILWRSCVLFFRSPPHHQDPFDALYRQAVSEFRSSTAGRASTSAGLSLP